ncbi:hypothetical protein [Blautia sp. MSJ-19]|uniref:hypothetical protein n=1 Tax=Blautia sp. MSJ-19 TaxID=2841517 RepID=UPI001C0EBB27|nr:hypothetical protein [Blautia sp. MSJ-19]MBU5480635.1 hypothetical protein [Blautia sp. MSJ-19]
MMVQMKTVLFHIAVICGFVCAVAKILDWYNPYMDFGGHLAWAGMTGCVAVFLFGVLSISGIIQRDLEMKRTCHRNGMHHHHMKTHYHQVV